MSSEVDEAYENLEIRDLVDPYEDKRLRDDVLIRIMASAIIAIILALAILYPDTARDAIQNARTWVTRYFSWYFVLLASAALLFCVLLAFSRFGTIRLGGPKAKPAYSRFAWYSMLFACGQGIGLIFWSVAEPIMLQNDNPLLQPDQLPSRDGAIAWSYFHWAVTAWAIYCTVAVCIAYSTHNRQQKPSFRGAVEDMIKGSARRPVGVAIEFVAILTTVLGISTSFGFASLQFTSGVSAASGIEGSQNLKIGIVVAIGVIAAISVFFGVEKGMKRVSELNSVLSIVLVGVVFVFGPTMYLLHLLPQSFGAYIDSFVGMSFYTDPAIAAQGIDSWTESWNGWWSVFIWCWCFAFSPFVASFIASVSRGRTIREFIFGVIAVPSVIVLVWIGVIGGAALEYDMETNGAITDAVMEDTSSGLFAMAEHIPTIGSAVIILATVLVATYFITSLDSGVHALSSFVSMGAKPSAIFRVVLVFMIVGISLLLLTLGGDSALDTIQTGTIIGALPFTVIVLLMVINLLRRIYLDTYRFDEDLTDEHVTADQL